MPISGRHTPKKDDTLNREKTNSKRPNVQKDLYTGKIYGTRAICFPGSTISYPISYDVFMSVCLSVWGGRSKNNNVEKRLVKGEVNKVVQLLWGCVFWLCFEANFCPIHFRFTSYSCPIDSSSFLFISYSLPIHSLVMFIHLCSFSMHSYLFPIHCLFISFYFHSCLCISFDLRN